MTPTKLSFLLGVVLLGCNGGKTYAFDTTGSYEGDAILTTGGAGGAAGSSFPIPGAQMQLDAGTKLTLGPSCVLSVAFSSKQSTDDSTSEQSTNTDDLAYEYTAAANQPCTLETAGTSRTFTVTDGRVRVTSDGFATVSVGGDDPSGTGGSFVYTFDGASS